MSRFFFILDRLNASQLCFSFSPLNESSSSDTEQSPCENDNESFGKSVTNWARIPSLLTLSCYCIRVVPPTRVFVTGGPAQNTRTRRSVQNNSFQRQLADKISNYASIDEIRTLLITGAQVQSFLWKMFKK